MDGRRRSSPQGRYFPSIFSGRRVNSRSSKASNNDTTSEPSSPGAACSVESTKKTQKKVKQVLHYYFTRKSRRRSSGSPSQCSVVSAAPTVGPPPAQNIVAEPDVLQRTVTGSTLMNIDMRNEESVVPDVHVRIDKAEVHVHDRCPEDRFQAKLTSRGDAFDGEDVSIRREKPQHTTGDEAPRPTETSDAKSIVLPGFCDLNMIQPLKPQNRSLKTPTVAIEQRILDEGENGDDDPFKALASDRSKASDSRKFEMCSLRTNEPAVHYQTSLFESTNEDDTGPFQGCETPSAQPDQFDFRHTFVPETAMPANDCDDVQTTQRMRMFDEPSTADIMSWSEPADGRSTFHDDPQDLFLSKEFDAPQCLPPAPPPSPSDEPSFLADRLNEFPPHNRRHKDVNDRELPRRALSPHIPQDSPSPKSSSEDLAEGVPQLETTHPIVPALPKRTRAIPPRRHSTPRALPDVPIAPEFHEDVRMRPGKRNFSLPLAKDRAATRTPVTCATPLGDGDDIFNMSVQASRLPKPLTPKPALIAGHTSVEKGPLPGLETTQNSVRRNLLNEYPTGSPEHEQTKRDMGIQAGFEEARQTVAPSVSTQTVAPAEESWVETAVKTMEQVELRRSSSQLELVQEEKFTIPLWVLIVVVTLLSAVAHYCGMRLRCGMPYCN